MAFIYRKIFILFLKKGGDHPSDVLVKSGYESNMKIFSLSFWISGYLLEQNIRIWQFIIIIIIIINPLIAKTETSQKMSFKNFSFKIFTSVLYTASNNPIPTNSLGTITNHLHPFT